MAIKRVVANTLTTEGIVSEVEIVLKKYSASGDGHRMFIPKYYIRVDDVRVEVEVLKVDLLKSIYNIYLTDEELQGNIKDVVLAYQKLTASLKAEGDTVETDDSGSWV